MSYKDPRTIKEVLISINNNEYFLPSIQREFVWGIDKIQKLFDSLIRDYPIGTFLFWEVGEKVKDFQFYEFLKEYHERDKRHNEKKTFIGGEEIFAILDGQQRITSLYLGLQGSYTEKKKGARKADTTAYQKKKLYLNLLKQTEDEGIEMEYDFKFLTKFELDKLNKEKDSYFWFECSKIFDVTEKKHVSDYLDKVGLTDAVYGKEVITFASETLEKFREVIHEKKVISYYLEKSDELDKVLQIFIRVNSGGVSLSHSDLLLSVATAHWKKTDARDVIHKFVDDINNIGDKYSFNKDFVLKACLMLSGLDVVYKVDNFNRENMLIIEKKWEEISKALSLSVDLIHLLGYRDEALSSKNAIIPIAYYIYKNGYDDKEILESSNRSEDRKLIKQWLARVLLKGVFGSASDSLYSPMRELIDNNLNSFPLNQIIEDFKQRWKSITFTEEDIDALLDLKYGKPKTYSALALLYENIDGMTIHEQDHIHPKAAFSKESVPEGKLEAFKEKKDAIYNLQLISGTYNREKMETPFEEWINDNYDSEVEKNAFLQNNHIPIDISLGFESFLEFCEIRREFLKKKFMKILGVVKEEYIYN